MFVLQFHIIKKNKRICIVKISLIFINFSSKENIKVGWSLLYNTLDHHPKYNCVYRAQIVFEKK